MQTLVTGATGLVGSALVRRLVERGETVRILRRSESTLDLLGPAAESVEHAIGDVTDPDSVARAMDGVSNVYHVAALISMGGRGAERALHDVNVRGTAHVLDAARSAGVVRVVHTSSIAALGRTTQSGRLDESAEWTPSPANTMYARSKYAAELEVHRAVAEGLDAVMVNPSVIFGTGRRGDNTRQVIDRVRERRLPAYPTGATNVVDVEDVVEGHLLAMERGERGQRYILGGDNLSWKEIMSIIAAAFGVPPPRRSLPLGAAMAYAMVVEGFANALGRKPVITRESVRLSSRRFSFDNGRAREELGWSHRPFRETVERIARDLRTSA